MTNKQLLLINYKAIPIIQLNTYEYSSLDYEISSIYILVKVELYILSHNK